jgi:ribulose 1,5-bisphosphate synthetase/thiazole synthase
MTENQFSRREFIKLSGTASIAVLAYPMSSCNTDEATKSEHAVFQNDTLPVITKCDVIVVGGSFSGVSTALAFAKNGKKVVLVEKRIYLGREVTSTCRPWIDLVAGSELPELVQSCVEKDIDQPFQDKALLRFDHVKLTLENALLENNVDIMYASIPVQLVLNKNETAGLVIGNKSGRQVILSKMIVDCTETASVIRLTNCGFQAPAPENSTFIRTLEFTQIKPLNAGYIDVPASLNIQGNRVNVQRGYINDNHYYVQCPIVYDNPDFDAESTVRREVDAWERSIGVAKYLYEEAPEFSDAFLCNSSYQLQGIYSGPMQPLSPERLADIPKARINFGGHQIDMTSLATAHNNLWCINEAARLTHDQAKYLLTPQGACQVGAAVSAGILESWEDLAAGSYPETHPADGKQEDYAPVMIKEKYSPHRGKDYHRIKIDNQPIRVLAEVDVLVVGGGSSGAPAAYVAAEQGKRTMVIDLNPGFGGTGTYAGINSYWGNGQYNGFTARHIRNLNEIHEYIPDQLPSKNLISWNIQAKMYMWLREIKKSGAQILWNSVVIGSIMEDNKVGGVVVATPQGVFSIKSKVVIDATGDGDVAAFAGATSVLGSSRDHVPMWCALCKQFTPGKTGSGFQYVVDITNIHDYTRSVQTGLRIGQNAHDHSSYLATRESRHVQGDVTLTLTDHLKFTQWEDVINVHFSNCDMKGYHSSDWQRIGMIPGNVKVEIPYRSIVPKNIENMLVVGKAFSAKHDSLAQVRMQHDLENLGGIAALAASDAIDNKVFPRDINVKELQKQLIELGLIPSDAIDRQIKPNEYTKTELENLINHNQFIHTYSRVKPWMEEYTFIPFVEVCISPKEKAIPVLERKLKESTGKRALRIAQALALLGSGSGAEIIFQEIQNHLNKWDELPPYEYEIETLSPNHAPPDHGIMPQCAYLIYALGMTRSKLNIKAWELVSDHFQADELVDFYNRNNKSLFNYVDAMCYGAGLLGSRAAIPSLNKIHSNRFLNDQSIKNDTAGEYISGIQAEFIYERVALLELIIGRALARSGSVDGLEILVEYLDDARAILTEFAHTTLIKITEKDFGKNKREWTDWISVNVSDFQPVPLKERIDG